MGEGAACQRESLADGMGLALHFLGEDVLGDGSKAVSQSGIAATGGRPRPAPALRRSRATRRACDVGEDLPPGRVTRDVQVMTCAGPRQRPNAMPAARPRVRTNRDRPAMAHWRRAASVRVTISPAVGRPRRFSSSTRAATPRTGAMDPDQAIPGPGRGQGPGDQGRRVHASPADPDEPEDLGRQEPQQERGEGQGQDQPLLGPAGALDDAGSGAAQGTGQDPHQVGRGQQAPGQGHQGPGTLSGQVRRRLEQGLHQIAAAGLEPHQGQPGQGEAEHRHAAGPGLCPPGRAPGRDPGRRR